MQNCIICEKEMPVIDGRSKTKKYCSRECLCAMRRAKHIPKPKIDYSIPLEDRIYKRVLVTEAGCWEWQGAKNNKGYGQVGYQGKIILAHRASWKVTHGSFPDGMLVRHQCDNPPCINPGHLEVGTYKDNMQDAIKRNRFVVGENHQRCVVSDEAVRIIRSEYRVFTTPGLRGRQSNKKELAQRFGVSEGHIKEIIAGRERKYVSD